MAQTSQQALIGATPEQEALPIVGNLIGDIWGPVGGMVGKEIGTATGNTIATGDFAGAAAGTPASNASNLGGLFQGQGLQGLIHNWLLQQWNPESSMNTLAAVQQMRGGIGGPSVGEGYTGGASPTSADVAGGVGLAGQAMNSPMVGSWLGTGGGSIDSLLGSWLGSLF
jgi:uncharacterized protein YcfJ